MCFWSSLVICEIAIVVFPPRMRSCCAVGGLQLSGVFALAMMPGMRLITSVSDSWGLMRKLLPKKPVFLYHSSREKAVFSKGWKPEMRKNMAHRMKNAGKIFILIIFLEDKKVNYYW